MSDPVRWIEEEGISPRERDLLCAGLSMDPPSGEQDRVWAALLTQVGPGGPDGDGGAGAAGGAAAAKAGVAASAAGAGKAAGALAVGGVVKSMLIGAAGAGLFVASYAVVAPPPRPPSAPVEARVQVVEERSAALGVPAGAGAAAAPAPGMDEAEEPSVEAGAPRGEKAAGAKAGAGTGTGAESGAGAVPGTGAGAEPGAGSAAAERESRLREEREMIGAARAALRAGNAAGALPLLEQARARFPGGALGQEREALFIEALFTSGQRAAASDRAAAFVSAHPQSPHAARVQGFIQP